MSNGIGKNPLTDISKVYLQQIANEGTMDIKGFAIPKSEQDAAKKRVQDKTKKKQIEKGISSAGYTKEGLDPVNPVAVKKKFANRKDRDLDNDGDTDSSDKYLHKRRKAIAGAMKKRMSEASDPRDEAAMKKFQALQKNVDQKKKLNIRGNDSAEQKARLEKKRGMKLDDHPQYKKEEVEQVDENRAAARAAGGYKDDSKKQTDPSKAGFTGISGSIKDIMRQNKEIEAKNKKMKESFSNWRTDLSEVMTDEIDSKPVKEKKINNKIKINPKLGEAVEELGGEILEVTEVDEAVYGGTPAKKEEPKDNRMVVTAADKKGNTPAYQRMKAGDKRYKAADHMKEQAAMSDKEIRLQKQKARIDQMIAMRRKQDLAQTKKSEEPAKAVGEEVVSERTRFAKETGKDFKTGNPSEKGGTRTGTSAFDKVSREMRKTGGVMSSRGKAIQPQGKKKEPGKKGYKGVTPVDKIKNRLAQKRAAKPNPYRARAGESD